MTPFQSPLLADVADILQMPCPLMQNWLQVLHKFSVTSLPPISLASRGHHGLSTVTALQQSSAPWAHRTTSSTRTTLSSGTCWYGHILLFWFKPPPLKQTLFWLPLSIRFSKEIWTGWRESQKGSQSWSEGRQDYHMKKVLGNLACSALRKEGLWDTSLKSIRRLPFYKALYGKNEG